VSPPHPEPPDEIVVLARQRTGARATHDWVRADGLRAEIEAAGWKVIDRGTAFRLEPAAPPTVEDEGVVRYGAASAVPSVLEEPPSSRFSVELVADDWPDDLARMLTGLRAHAPGGTQVVIVANDPSPEQAARLAPGTPDLGTIAGAEPEVIWTSERLGPAAARNVGLRRARGAIIVLADTSIEPAGDALGPLEAVLDDPGVAVTGAFGFVSSDLRRFQDAPGPSVDAVELDWAAFRRDEYIALGPLDEKLTSDRNLATWWSLVLRAGPQDEPTPRGAVRLDLPLVRHAGRASSTLPEVQRERRAKRDFYRVLDQFRHRRDLLSGTASGATNPPQGGAPLEDGSRPRDVGED
jgi:hypothetical protein